MWMTTELGLKESYSEPATLYSLAKARGMTHVTLTDHDSIEGALRLAHHEDFVVGEEVSAFFPAEALHVHVLVWGIDELQHTEIGELRFNVYELADYLRGHGVAHALAHPFSLVAGGLRGEQLEALVSLFDVWEVRNGLSSREENELAEDVAARSGSIGACAGSDDHACIDVGTTYTAIPLGQEDGTPLAAVMAGRGRPCGSHGSTAKLAHNGAALFLGRDPSAGGIVARTAGHLSKTSVAWSLLTRPGGRRLAAGAMSLSSAARRLRRGDRGGPLDVAVRQLSRELLSDDVLIRGVSHEELSTQVEGAWRQAMHGLLGEGEHVAIGELAADRKRLAAIADAQGLLAPYLFAAGFHARQRRHAQAVRERLAERGLALRPGRATMPRVAMFTDTYDEVNGVATVLHALVGHANAHEWPFTLVSAGKERRSEPGHEVFPAVESRSLDVYPGFPMALLPVLEILQWCEDNDITVIHAATPGPVGLVAWLLANSLDLPLMGTYHTDLPNLGFSLTGDHLLRESLWASLRFFYDQCDLVFCPSEATRVSWSSTDSRAAWSRSLRASTASSSTPSGATRPCGSISAVASGCSSGWAGFHRRRAWTLSRPPTRPCARDAVMCSWWSSVRARIANAWENSPRRRPSSECARAPSSAAIFASADVFLFPGHAETFGQAVLEAAAAGLPAVVSAGSGTEDAMVRNVTALSVAPGDARGFVAAVEQLLDDGDLHARMSEAARRFAVGRTWPATFERVADAYRTVVL